MSTSAKEDQDFIREIIPSTLLEDAIEWIKNNFGMEEIYGRDALVEWAKENGYVEDDEY